MRFIAAAACLIVLVALAGSAEGQVVAPRFEPSTSAVDPGVNTALLSTAAVQTGPAEIADTRRIPSSVPIDWAQARRDAEAEFIDQTTGSTRPVPVRPVNVDTADLDGVTLPVLLPAAHAVALAGATTRLFSREDFYTASIIGGDMVVEIFGTRLSHGDAPDMAARERLAAARNEDGYVLSRGPGSWDVSFNRYGAAYSVTVECGDPGDSRCADEEYALQITEALMIAGGRPETGR